MKVAKKTGPKICDKDTGWRMVKEKAKELHRDLSEKEKFAVTDAFADLKKLTLTSRREKRAYFHLEAHSIHPQCFLLCCLTFTSNNVKYTMQGVLNEVLGELRASLSDNNLFHAALDAHVRLLDIGLIEYRDALEHTSEPCASDENEQDHPQTSNPDAQEQADPIRSHLRQDVWQALRIQHNMPAVIIDFPSRPSLVSHCVLTIMLRPDNIRPLAERIFNTHPFAFSPTQQPSDVTMTITRQNTGLELIFIDPSRLLQEGEQYADRVERISLEISSNGVFLNLWLDFAVGERLRERLHLPIGQVL